MMEHLSTILVKLVGSGLVCGGLLSLSGKGAQREIMRFGCACIMIVLLLSRLHPGEISLPGLCDTERDIEQKIAQEQEEYRYRLADEVRQSIEDEIVKQAKALSISCKAKLHYRIDDTGSFSIDSVVIEYTGGPRDRLSELTASVRRLMNVTEEQIEIREEGT